MKEDEKAQRNRIKEKIIENKNWSLEETEEWGKHITEIKEKGDGWKDGGGKRSVKEKTYRKVNLIACNLCSIFVLILYAKPSRPKSVLILD
jgi:hypothetical protein